MHAELKTHAHAVANCVSLELECRLFINPGAFEDFGLVIAGEKPAPATSKKKKKKKYILNFLAFIVASAFFL